MCIYFSKAVYNCLNFLRSSSSAQRSERMHETSNISPSFHSTAHVSLPWVSLFRKLSLSACFLNGCGSTANTTGFVEGILDAVFTGQSEEKPAHLCIKWDLSWSLALILDARFFGLGLETIFGFHSSRAGLHLSRKNVGDLLDIKSWPWHQCVCFWANFQYPKRAFTWVIWLDLILLWYAWCAF